MSQATTTQNYKVLGNKKLMVLAYSCPPFFFLLKFALKKFKKKKILIKIICYIFEILFYEQQHN